MPLDMLWMPSDGQFLHYGPDGLYKIIVLVLGVGHKVGFKELERLLIVTGYEDAALGYRVESNNALNK